MISDPGGLKTPAATAAAAAAAGRPAEVRLVSRENSMIKPNRKVISGTFFGMLIKARVVDKINHRNEK